MRSSVSSRGHDISYRTDEGGFTGDTLELAVRLGVETHLIPDADHVTAFTRSRDVLEVVRPFLDKFQA